MSANNRKDRLQPVPTAKAIIAQHERFLESEFVAFAQKLNSKIKPILSKDPDLIRLALVDIDYKVWTNSKRLKQGIERNYKLIDAWVKSKIAPSSVVETGRDGRTKRDAADPSPELIQNQLYAEHWAKVRDIVRDGVVTGRAQEDIYNDILQTTDMNKTRAKFWAGDQISQYEAEIARVTSIREGYTHYVWVAGASARPTHAANGGKVFSWNVGADNLTRPGARHPHEDYRCHCTFKNLTEAEAAKLGRLPEPPRQPASVEQLVANYYGKEASVTARNAFGSVLNTIGIKNTFHPEFIQTSTIPEAEEYAKSKLGIDVKYGTEVNLLMANQLNNYLTYLYNEVSGKLPDVVLTELANHNLAIYDPIMNILKINKNSDFWKDPQTVLKEQKGVWSTQELMHPFRHEYSHYYWKIKNSDRYKYLQNLNLDNYKSLIIERLGEAATINGLEFVAEVYARKKAGLPIDKEIWKLYKELGGDL